MGEGGGGRLIHEEDFDLKTLVWKTTSAPQVLSVLTMLIAISVKAGKR